MPDPQVYCPACKSVYPAGTRECYRCKRPGVTPITQRHSALLPVEEKPSAAPSAAVASVPLYKDTTAKDPTP